MSERITLTVEVNIQDYFFANSSPLDQADQALEKRKPEVNPNRSLSAAPIAPETWELWFRRWLEVLEPDFPGNAYEVSLRLTDDAEIQSFNAQYRQKDQPTDVLAFAALEVDSPLPEEMQSELPLYLGDIVISVETAQVQAAQQGHSLEQELAWLAAHALLHLLGWDHPDESSLHEMLNQQESLLQTIGIRSGYYHGEPAQSINFGMGMGRMTT